MKFTEADVVARVETVTVEELRIWVSEGWLVPESADDGPVFDEIDVARLRLVCALRQDLDLADDAVPTILSLIDQIHGLRAELKALAAAVDQESETTRARIRKAYRTAKGWER